MEKLFLSVIGSLFVVAVIMFLSLCLNSMSVMLMRVWFKRGYYHGRFNKISLQQLGN